MLLVGVVLAMLMVAPTSVGVKSTRLCLRFQYPRLRFSRFLFVDLSLPSGPPCLICVQLSLWCSRCGVVSARSPGFRDASFQSRRVYSIHVRVVALSSVSRCQLTFPCSAFRNDLRVRAPFVAEIPDQEIALQLP